MKWLFFLIPYFCHAQISNADQITYEWLSEEAIWDHDTEYVKVLKKIFQNTRVKSMLELGVGYSTKYFLDSCNKVISVDIITHGYGPGNLKSYIDLYKDYSNWIPIAYFSGYLGSEYHLFPYKHLGSDAAYKATAYQHGHQKHYAKIDSFYLTELGVFLSNLLKYNKIDLAFIGTTTWIRGDFVELLFNKVSIIVAHNTDNRMRGEEKDIFGLQRVKTPENYEEIFFPVEGGTTVWIRQKEETQKLIETLKTFAAEL